MHEGDPGIKRLVDVFILAAEELQSNRLTISALGHLVEVRVEQLAR